MCVWEARGGGGVLQEFHAGKYICAVLKLVFNSHLDSANITCSEGFFFDNEDSNGRNATNTCKPACGEFLRKPRAQQFFENLGVCGSLVAGVLMFIIATTVQRKTL